MKTHFTLLLAIGLLALVIGMAILDQHPSPPGWVTFDQCEKIGGVAWSVNLYHPDICPDCAALLACQEEHPKNSDLCSQVEVCSECMAENFPYPGSCPEGRQSVGKISDAAMWFLCCK